MYAAAFQDIVGIALGQIWINPLMHILYPVCKIVYSS